jgi:hypothetical protein
MAEYSLDLEPGVKEDLLKTIEKVGKIKSVRKMNKMLYHCKDLILSLKFHPEDSHHAYLRD